MAVITKTREKPTRKQQAYRPYGAAETLLYARQGEVLLSGPAGTGKSRSCLEKMHLVASKYAGSRQLILRKTRASLTDSALVTFEDKVVPPGHPILDGPKRDQRHAYRYPNGSEIVIGGLDKPSKVMSTEYDIAYIQEAIEVTEHDWESVSTRLRNGVVPYQQIIADTNPDSPSHWLKRRCDRGQCVLLESRHEDNPTVTPEYLARLDALTGVRYHRLRHGLWVAAEGMVYDGWNPAVHFVDRFLIPPTWRRWWSVDFGYTHPFVWQAWAEDGDGRLYRYREIYHSHRLVEDLAREILRATAGEPRPEQIVCDHDAEDRATLERHLGMETVAAYKSVSPGIQAVASRLRPAGDGKPRIFFVRDSLFHGRDEWLDERKQPCCTEEEIEGYVWNTKAGRLKGEEPVKESDHGLDAARYLVAAVDRISGDAQGETVQSNYLNDVYDDEEYDPWQNR